MAMFASALVTDTMAQYRTCPVHVDTQIARLQDELHTEMATQEGALLDWWTALNPPPDPEPEARAMVEEEGGDEVLPSEPEEQTPETPPIGEPSSDIVVE
jgi:hypothetical protein